MIIPVVSYIAHLNQMIKFPDSLRTIENWLKLNEEATETLFKSWTANMTCQNLFINILVLALIPGVCEEFLFRGTIQPFLNKVFKNIHVAILVSAFLFSIIHFQFNGFIPRFLLGIYLGYLVLWSGSLWTSVAAHFLHNACSLLLDFGLKKNGINMDNYTPNDIPGFYGLLIVSIIFLGTGIWILWYGASIMPKTTISTNNNITENEI
jgi:membrane protease YdiL (CAAX protease family)